MMKKIIDEAIKTAINSVNPYFLIKNSIKLNGNFLEIENCSINLNNFNKIYVFSIGKAGFPMAEAISEILLNRISKGIVLTKYGYTKKGKKLKNFEIIEAGHPIPDENSLKGTKKILGLLKNIDKNTLIINLISGGGSSLFEFPDYNLTLHELKLINDVLLKIGADIFEINAIRKFISKVKGGKFAKLCFPAKIVSLILSDVVGDRLDTISSGPTVKDTSDYKAVFEKYKKELKKKLPDYLIKIFEKGNYNKVEDKYFSNVFNIIIGNNLKSLKALKIFFKDKNFNSYILSSHITGEAKEIGKFFSALCIDILKGSSDFKLPVAIISGGETEVNVKGSGIGGRNQELVLSFLISINKFKEFLTKDIYFLSFGTDGTDGPTDSAGAIFTNKLLEIIKKRNLNPQKFLENNDSFTFFSKVNSLIKTGPTYTNVCDIQLLIINS